MKAVEGAGGLLDSLVTANMAAPLSLPDLVLLPQSLLESATLKGLLYPFDGASQIMKDPNWFDYARQLAKLQSSTFGIPFAGDAMILAYHQSHLTTPPSTFEDCISLGEVMLYPATDQQALFTISSYLADHGSLQDDQGRPMLDEAALIEIYEIDRRASLAGVMPYTLTQYSNDTQVWEAFMSNEFPSAITWSSTYLANIQSAQKDLAMAPIPTINGARFTLATGWSWALAGQDPVRRAMAVRLAEYLVDTDFMAAWSSAAGYLPPREDALQLWKEAELRTTVEQISKSAQLVPPTEMLSSLGPALEQSLVDVLKAQSDPQTAARNVINKIRQP